MSDETIGRVVTAICYSLPPTLVALAGLLQGRATKRTVSTNDEKTDVLLTKADEIHELANGNLASMKAELEVATNKIQELETVIQRMHRAWEPPA